MLGFPDWGKAVTDERSMRATTVNREARVRAMI
jgi:hypothetical protein